MSYVMHKCPMMVAGKEGVSWQMTASKQVGEHGVVSLCGQPGWGKTETY